MNARKLIALAFPASIAVLTLLLVTAPTSRGVGVSATVIVNGYKFRPAW